MDFAGLRRFRFSAQGSTGGTVPTGVAIRPVTQSALASLDRVSEAFERSAQDVVRMAGAPSAAETAETVRISPEARQAGTATDRSLTSGIEGAMVDMRVAKYAFIANLKVLQAGAEMDKAATEMFSSKG
jgi:hypothetical protein